jgi:hypothetical protein
VRSKKTLKVFLMTGGELLLESPLWHCRKGKTAVGIARKAHCGNRRDSTQLPMQNKFLTSDSTK